MSNDFVYERRTPNKEKGKHLSHVLRTFIHFHLSCVCPLEISFFCHFGHDTGGQVGNLEEMETITLLCETHSNKTQFSKYCI